MIFMVCTFLCSGAFLPGDVSFEFDLKTQLHGVGEVLLGDLDKKKGHGLNVKDSND